MSELLNPRDLKSGIAGRVCGAAACPVCCYGSSSTAPAHGRMNEWELLRICWIGKAADNATSLVRSQCAGKEDVVEPTVAGKGERGGQVYPHGGRALSTSTNCASYDAHLHEIAVGNILFLFHYSLSQCTILFYTRCK